MSYITTLCILQVKYFMVYLIKEVNKRHKVNNGGIKMIVEMFNKLPWYKKMEVLRVVKGWGQRKAGEECFTNNKNYWLWEKGKSYPRGSSRKAIAKAYGLKIEYIFYVNDKIVNH